MRVLTSSLLPFMPSNQSLRRFLSWSLNPSLSSSEASLSCLCKSLTLEWCSLAAAAKDSLSSLTFSSSLTNLPKALPLWWSLWPFFLESLWCFFRFSKAAFRRYLIFSLSIFFSGLGRSGFSLSLFGWASAVVSEAVNKVTNPILRMFFIFISNYTCKFRAILYIRCFNCFC